MLYIIDFCLFFTHGNVRVYINTIIINVFIVSLPDSPYASSHVLLSFRAIEGTIYISPNCRAGMRWSPNLSDEVEVGTLFHLYILMS